MYVFVLLKAEFLLNKLQVLSKTEDVCNLIQKKHQTTGNVTFRNCRYVHATRERQRCQLYEERNPELF